MFSKILVANRGEIAIRVMRACRELGISTVAVYSEADKNALFVKYADEAYFIGPPQSAQSYLNMDNIVDAIHKSGSEAVHPGYGFLSENADFVKRCKSDGIVFIGPSEKTIRGAGSKIEARKTMQKAGIPVIPGTEERIENVEHAISAAEEIGYPVIVKSSAGGGGIGMKVVKETSEIEQTIESTQSVARSVFGDETVFIEKYLEEPRHIEFQILADSHDNIVHLCDRECSIQRRHQKLIEEAPSPAMTVELRERMGASAIKAAKVIDYVNSGTIEFLYSKGDYYFLEVNTRLQVEHPITEVITGVDLVKEQINIAYGDEISMKQQDVHINGWAIECRINAEDPLSEFTPSPGRIRYYRSPGGPGVRVDSGVYAGYTISPYYDSLVSKLSVWAPSRMEAISRMKRALYEYIIVGVKTNIPFHKAVMNSRAFQNGELTTHFIDDHHILRDVEKLAHDEKSKGGSLAAALETDNKKIAAVTAAVGAYLNQRR
ncbi:MAG: Pyruvate carboxylase subunit A [Candidatus Argoarchaeum ethanivorans]|uniref:Pyruvate carboxylase subunit A n=1 Tax=Candidatus Argoarchaeum ethanivorans TaxID=2608793 RepID=A0A811T623_9EURY|nr:MAG: Pyruvate carboxylase subunit A [Candidatus Argoarchaeum ethanivorans]